MTDFIPYRPCCGQQHWGAQCPDGRVMCCLCFDKFTLEQLNKNEEGQLEDVCKECAEFEKREMARMDAEERAGFEWQ